MTVAAFHIVLGSMRTCIDDWKIKSQGLNYKWESKYSIREVLEITFLKQIKFTIYDISCLKRVMRIALQIFLCIRLYIYRIF